MSTVEEIESAIEQLPLEKVDEVAHWLEAYRGQLKGQSDPILALGESPINCDVKDASVEHDRYITAQ